MKEGVKTWRRAALEETGGIEGMYVERQRVCECVGEGSRAFVVGGRVM